MRYIGQNIQFRYLPRQKLSKSLTPLGKQLKVRFRVRIFTRNGGVSGDIGGFKQETDPFR